MTVPVQRDARGRLLPGASLNPGGRSSDLSAVRAELREHSVTAARALVELLGHPDPGTRLRAIEIFYDRLCGKPVQATDATIQTLDIGKLWLEAVQMPPAPHEPKIIDASPINPPIGEASTLPHVNEADDDRHHEEW
jgi:hypothetical protein